MEARFMDHSLQTEYEVVEGQKKLGDIVLLLDEKSEVVHSAVFIADDIVFTKLGGSSVQPWIYMRMEDMLPYYEMSEGKISTTYVRRKTKVNYPNRSRP